MLLARSVDGRLLIFEVLGSTYKACTGQLIFAQPDTMDREESNELETVEL